MRTSWCFTHGSDQCDCFMDFMRAFVANTGDTHTHADLAMALELAELLESEHILADQIIGYDRIEQSTIYTFDWLRAEVIAALRGDQ